MFTAWRRKLDGFADIAPDFKARIEKTAPEYFSAPKEWVQPNATTWSAPKKWVLDK